jgi:hypothetical protein
VVCGCLSVVRFVGCWVVVWVFGGCPCVGWLSGCRVLVWELCGCLDYMVPVRDLKVIMCGVHHSCGNWVVLYIQEKLYHVMLDTTHGMDNIT